MPPNNSRLPREALKEARGFARRSSPFFVVRSRPNRLSRFRFAVVVSAKVDRTAVGRHRLKRRVQERLRQWRDGQDVIFTVLPPAKHLSRKDFFREMDRILT